VFDGAQKNRKIIETVAGTVSGVRQYVWAAGHRCEERDASGAMIFQLFSRGEVSPTVTLLYTRDHLGSVRATSDSSGNVQSEFAYDPFGRHQRIRGASDSQVLYCSYYFHDRSKLSMTRTRCYMAKIGRWLNRDPISEKGGLNLYGYIDNSPLRYTDSSGLKSSIQDLRQRLINMCKSRKCVSQANEADCIKAANTLADVLERWYEYFMDPAHHGDAPEGDDDARNRFWCWSWARGFRQATQAANGGLFTSDYRTFYDTNGDGNHWAVDIHTGGAGGTNPNDPCCHVTVDDSFFNDGPVHDPDWQPPVPGWEENHPAPRSHEGLINPKAWMQDMW